MNSVPVILISSILVSVVVIGVILFLFGDYFPRQIRTIALFSKALLMFSLYEGASDHLIWKGVWFSGDFNSTDVVLALDHSVLSVLVIGFWLLLGIISLSKELFNQTVLNDGEQYFLASDLLGSVGLLIACLSTTVPTLVFGLSLIVIAMSMGLFAQTFEAEGELIRNHYQKIHILFLVLILIGCGLLGYDKTFETYLMESSTLKSLSTIGQIPFVLSIWIGLGLFPLKSIFGKLKNTNILWSFLSHQGLLGVSSVLVACRFLPTLIGQEFNGPILVLFSILGIYSIVGVLFSKTWIEGFFFLFATFCTFAVQMRLILGQNAAIITLMIGLFINFFVFLGAEIDQKKRSQQSVKIEDEVWLLSIPKNLIWIPGLLVSGLLGWIWNTFIIEAFDKSINEVTGFIFLFIQVTSIFFGVWILTFRANSIEKKKFATLKDNIFHWSSLLLPVSVSIICFDTKGLFPAVQNIGVLVLFVFIEVVSFSFAFWSYRTEKSKPHIWIQEFPRVYDAFQSNMYIFWVASRIGNLLEAVILVLTRKVFDPLFYNWPVKTCQLVFGSLGFLVEWLDKVIVQWCKVNCSKLFGVSGRALQAIHDGDIQWYLGLGIIGIVILLSKFVPGGV